MSLKYTAIPNGSFVENCFLVWCDETFEGIFIDPGDEPERLMAVAESKNVKIKAIYNTHGHFDHTGAVLQIQETLKVPFFIHKADEALVGEMILQASLFGVPPVDTPKVNHTFVDGDTIQVGNQQATIIHTPGHSPGGACFLFEKVIFVGDTLFAGSVGRSDLPGGSHKQLINSINERLMTLDKSIVVCSGHGPETTIGHEKQSNPFINEPIW